MNKILVTGASSFSAAHFVEVLNADPNAHWECHGTSRSHSSSKLWSSYAVGDITDEQFVCSLMERLTPTHVLHLAGASNPQKPDELFRTNLQGTWNLLAACTKFPTPPRVLLIGSAAGFGDMRENEERLDGGRAPRPNSLYGLVREQSLGIGKLFSEIHQLPVTCCRTFNIIGPGLPNKYAPSAILERILKSKVAGAASISVGNLDYVRDFIDVRDACTAWKHILSSGKTDRIYSVGSGNPSTIRELTEVILNCLSLTSVVTEIPSTAAINRSQITRSVADIGELVADTAWQPRISLTQSVQDMLHHYKINTIL